MMEFDRGKEIGDVRKAFHAVVAVPLYLIFLNKVKRAFPRLKEGRGWDGGC